MAVSESYRTYIEEQLSKFDGIEYKKMFGGIGVFKEGIMFSMVTSKDKFFMRVDEQNVSAFKAKGMEAFNSVKKGKGMPYYEGRIGQMGHDFL